MMNTWCFNKYGLLGIALLVTGCDRPASPPPPPPPPVAQPAPPPPPPVPEPRGPEKTPWEAVQTGDLMDLILHHQEGMSIHLKRDDGMSLLHEAVTHNRLAVAAWLLEQGAHATVRNRAGVEPMDVALADERHEMVPLLVAFGAQVPEENRFDDIADYEAEAPVAEEPEPEPQQELPAGWADMEFRTWTSATGQSIEAAFVEMRGDVVTLGARDGRVSYVPLNQLNRADQVRAREKGLAQTGRIGASGMPAPGQVRVTTGFTSDCERLLIRSIQRARREILVAIYTMTRPDIERALSTAAQRGVRVQVKYDAKQLSVGRMQELIKSMEQRGVTCIPITMSGRFASMHHKFAVIDDALIFTGSYNFTVTASTESYENCVLIESMDAARDFKREWERIRGR